MKRLLLGFLVAFVLILPGASAASINLYRREADISLLTAEIEDTIHFNEAPDVLEKALFFSVEEFSSRSTLDEHDCKIEDRDYGSLVTCNLSEGGSGRLSLEFKTNDLVNNIGDHYYFSDDMTTPHDTETLVYIARLEEGLVLISEEMETPFSRFTPGYGEERSDGRRIYVFWSDDDVSGGDGINPRVSFERTEEPVESIPETYVVILGVALIMLLLAVAIKMGNGEDNGMPDALKEDEIKVIKIVENGGGEIKQKRIVDSVDFSKAKVSRLIRDLKERGLLETKKVGRTNRVKLKKGE